MKMSWLLASICTTEIASPLVVHTSTFDNKLRLEGIISSQVSTKHIVVVKHISVQRETKQKIEILPA